MKEMGMTKLRRKEN